MNRQLSIAASGRAPQRLWTWHARLRRLAAQPLGSSGASAVEFGLTVPIIFMLMLASAELGRYILLHQKVDRVAVTMSDLVSRAETISETDLDDMFLAADQVALPFDLTGSGVVIVTSVTNVDGDGATVAWQRAGAGDLVSTSRIGAPGDPADLPDDFELREGETAIIAEVFFDFAPFLTDLIVAPEIVYRRAQHRPRLGTLEQIEAG